MSLKKKIIVIFCLSIFLFLYLMLYLNKLDNIDNYFYNHIILIKNNNVTNMMKFITKFGGFLFTFLFLIVFLIFNYKKGIYLAINVLIVLLINIILKNIIVRPRPIDINLIIESGYSFPSAHAMNSVALYGLLIYYFLNHSNKKLIHYILLFINCLLIILIPISRIYLGVHFFSDVIAGICISTIWLCIYTEYIRKKSIV